MEQKLEELETRITFQDQELQTLSDVVIRQQHQVDLLVEKIKSLQDKMKDMNPSHLVPESEETPPPHY